MFTASEREREREKSTKEDEEVGGRTNNKNENPPSRRWMEKGKENNEQFMFSEVS